MDSVRLGLEAAGKHPPPIDEQGLPTFPEPEWLKIGVDRTIIRGLQRRTNLPGLLRISTYSGLLGVFGGLTVWADPFWLKAVFFVVYSTVFAFSEPILHETHHRTPFRNNTLNEAVHYIAGLLVFKEPVRDRWLHAAHHTYTYYSDIDPEIQTERPPNLWTIGLDMFRLRYVPVWVLSTVRNAFSPLASIDPLARSWVPLSERRKMVWSARACVAFYFAVIGLAVAMESWYPIFFIFVARFVGAGLHSFVGLPQHAGLVENTDDWRQNTRTILVNPFTRLFY